MDSFKDLAGKAKEALAEHPEQVGQVVDKAGDLFDEKTGGKFADKVDSAQDAVKKALKQEG
ncbi:antitoxin [Speluncibacter jeojiensis]|uniref:Antitoxin n=1 Tax=Speluncibacter jeojiensis TaxID=2710754 RepID=A0A9X4M0C5_9ACTN|nr:antitoxin [Rhodococcus sp. D2-41]MDG3014861.1 antitoxin [Corynebacteriales bacterium D3-21]